MWMNHAKTQLAPFSLLSLCFSLLLFLCHVVQLVFALNERLNGGFPLFYSYSLLVNIHIQFRLSPKIIRVSWALLRKWYLPSPVCCLFCPTLSQSGSHLGWFQILLPLSVFSIKMLYSSSSFFICYYIFFLCACLGKFWSSELLPSFHSIRSLSPSFFILVLIHRSSSSWLPILFNFLYPGCVTEHAITH